MTDFRIDFAIIGAMKSGTTDLARKLAQHSSICFSEPKEPHFFNSREDWESNLEEYHSSFRPQSGQICGEGSTSYSDLATYPKVVERLLAYNSKLKLIYLVRHPIKRIQSQYAHRLMNGDAEPDVNLEFKKCGWRYVSQSSYGTTLRTYQDAFGSQNVLPLVFEDYVMDMCSGVASVCNFLSIPREDLSHISARNATVGSNRSRTSPLYYIDHILTYSPRFVRRKFGRIVSLKLREKPVLPADIIDELWGRLDPEVSLFEEVSGLDASSWRP
jgi:hypothetical protein